MSDHKENIVEPYTLLEIIYEIYKKDVKGGKLRYDFQMGEAQFVGKSATKRQTFHQTALVLKE